MTKTEIIRQAKHFFGKDRTFIRDLILSFEYKGEHKRQWIKDIRQLTDHPFKVSYGISSELVDHLREKRRKINWNWIGDISWEIDILLNKKIKKGYDWDKTLALKCNGTARMMTIYVSDVIPVYTIDLYYMTYNKKENFYEFGPILRQSASEKKLIYQFNQYLRNKGLTYLNPNFCGKKFKEIISDLNEDGNASLFDVLFTDIDTHQTEIKRFSDRSLPDNENLFSWTEFYARNGKLKKRIEHRHTAGNYLEITFNGKKEIAQVEVSRKKIKYRSFKLDIDKIIKRRARKRISGKSKQ